MADRGDQTVIRRTIIERGFRAANDSQPGGRAAVEAMRNFHNQHEEEKREMQELNTKFGAYLDRVKFLETQNRKLQAQLDDLKQKWGFDSGKVKEQYDQALVNLRKQIDDVTREKALAELRAKRAEYDASLIKHQTDFANELVNLDRNRFAMLKQQLEGSGSELDALRGRFEDKKQEIERSKNEVKRLLEQLENLKNEFDNESMARVMIQNELQTLEEQLAFMKAIHEEERNELASLGTLPIDVSQFYRTELTRAIADIKNDFEALSQAQRRELEEYYKIKTEEIREQAAEQKRKIEEARRSGAVEVMDLSSLKSMLSENRDNFNSLQKEHSDLSNHLRQLEEDFERISGEHGRAQNERDRELADLRAQAEQREQAIAAVLENNVSLRFEINTYRRLLEVEEGHLQRVEGGEGFSSGGRGSSSYHYQTGSSVSGGATTGRFDNQTADVSTKKMTVQKSARGPIAIDQVDPQGNFIVIENAGSTGKDQDMKGWTLRRKIDSKDDITYKFPDNFVLKSRSRIRILSRNASKGSINEKETLVAEGVQTWGTGSNMITRLLDANGDEKAFLEATEEHSIVIGNLSSRNQCHSNWHYLSNQSLCIIFATSEIGDVRWYDGYKGCESNSAQLLTLTHSNKLQTIEKKIYELEINNRISLDYFQQGAWIGKAKWSNEDLCDSRSTTIEDLQFNCMIVTMRSDDLSLCLKRVSCTEEHPFICESRALTEDELVETTMQGRLSWRCIINVIWCIIDSEYRKKKEKEALEAQKAELQAYITQFNFDIPSDTELSAESPSALMEQTDKPLVVAGSRIYKVNVHISKFFFRFRRTIMDDLNYRNIGIFIRNPANRDDNSYELVRAFNETCGGNNPPCIEPLKCIGGYCLCSQIAKTTDANNPLSFWANKECHTCPLDYTTTGTKCYSLVLTKDSQLNWERARERCKEHNGDLLVFRSDEEYKLMIAITKANQKNVEMPQRVPQDGTYFGSIWIGARLADWRGDGRFDLVSHGLPLTKKNQHWCAKSSLLGHEPNFVQLKATGERQACLGLAFFQDGSVCMHDWFCSWESYTLCEVHPPAPETSTGALQALEEKPSSGIPSYIIIGVVVLVFLACCIGAFYYLRKKQKIRGRTQSFDSTESGMSRNSAY
ncbi:hypothetical protein I4U23_001851 [Adineta vaga]|nr:hypothetical protein I4U23_001851 [Adineta vaga]